MLRSLRQETEGKLQMLLSPLKNGLDSLRAMGFLVSQHGQLGAIPPPPSLSVSPLKSVRSGGAIPSSCQKGYLSDTCAISYENKESACDTPLCDTISKGCCAIWGGISHWTTKVTAMASGRYPVVTRLGRLLAGTVRSEPICPHHLPQGPPANQSRA